MVAAFALLLIAPVAYAQRSSYEMMRDNNRMIFNRINGDMTLRNMCEDWKRKGEKVPAECAKYASSSTQSKPASPTATRFTPVAGDDSVKNFADSLGNTPEERQQILQLAGAGKELFAQKYKGRWDNTIAGAMTFFIVASYIVGTDEQPSADAENRLFDSLNATLAQSEIARASNAEKTALYNVLLASAGLPLVFYVDGKQNNNAGQVEQAKVMAAGFGRKLFNMEMHELTGMLGTGGVGTPVAAAPAARSTAPGGGAGLDGRYDCQVAALQFDGVSYVTQYRPTGMWFTIKGGNYSAQSGGGTIQASADVVSFRGGAYAGWRGARRGDAIVFRKDDQTNPRAGESIKSGDFRCGRRSG
ncbi:DUF6683 family protein [Thermomonas sp. HDW16]|uniref:DUF6683 family protein n=1 Tax=Thermomonas sp. HDW16 TaxID=2714945 RepID=UPI00140BC235|nr:DUF6683 family protein [Thermomonas sp. HDW16]QIL19366.1 hypothetical protein G7079_00670 [Thermomonas sp. HDW16]